MNSIESSLKLLNSLITKEKKIFKDTEGEVERYSSTDKRYDALLKKAERTHSDNDEWFIYVPSCFNDCLDISKTDRIVKTGHKVLNEETKKMEDEKKTIKCWTQGSRFTFHRGCILYDTPNAYQKWSEAIKKIRYCISIDNSMDAKPAMNFENRFSGLVEFTVFAHNHTKSNLEEIGKFTLSQDEFVRFLIKGNPDIIPI